MRGRKPSTIVSDAAATLSASTRPPAWLSSHAKKEWRRVLPILVERDIITDADLATLANYCAAIGTVIEAQAIVRREGMTFTGASGPKRHPAIGIANEATATGLRLAAELGLTPVSRSRPAVRTGAEDPGEDDLGL